MTEPVPPSPDSPRARGLLFDPAPPPLPWEQAAAADRMAVGVVLNLPLDVVYHYLVPDELRPMVQRGQRVRVPFGKGDKPIVGYVVETTTNVTTSRRLKSILELLDRDPLLSETMLELTRWIGQRYLCGWGQVLESVIPAGVKRQAGTREITCFQLAEGVADRLGQLKLPAKQRAILQVLQAADHAMTADDVTQLADCGVSPLATLRQKKLITAVKRRTEVDPLEMGEFSRQVDLPLNPEQRRALEAILEMLRTRHHRTALLHGVTGSGKTEVYIQAIREVVSYGKQAIVLVPEISLTPQTIRRFRSRFDSVAVLHSHLSDAERHAQWQRIAEGDMQVVVGARSAIFAPTPHLGLIVIDEEHETTFKQSSTPRYHAREVARERARRENVPLLLGSATPTLESLIRAESGTDLLLSLPERVEQRPLPPVLVVDTRNDPHVSRGESIGRALKNSIQTALQDGGQVILFLNLRGYSPVVWCARCGTLKCPQCDVSLTWHADRKKVMCHSCEYESAPPEVCPGCSNPGLKYFGTGTQRLEKEVQAKFPEARVLRMDSDSMKRPGSHDEALDSFRDGRVDVLLGTQMIAKGLDFPNVTLVGVIDADTLLHQPDLRAAERTFQLIAQVAGRTGRGERGGRVLVQSANPDEAVIQYAARHDYLAFSKMELASRRTMKAPPYASWARVILRGENEATTQAEARRLAELFRQVAHDAGGRLRILGPAPCPITRLRGQWRFHFQLAADHLEELLNVWKRLAPDLNVHPQVEFTIDVDPIDMR